MTRGRGRGRTGRGGRFSVRGNVPSHLNMPTVPISTLSPQQGAASSSGGPSNAPGVPGNAPPIQISHCSGIPNIQSEPAPTTLDQSNPIGEGEAESICVRRQRTHLTIANTGLEPSRLCSNGIFEAFRHELDPNGINWKSVPQGLKDFYYGEFKKTFYWDPSIESAVKSQWESKAARRYSDFVCKIKSARIQPDFVQDNVWTNWTRLWGDPKCVEKSETAKRNRCAGGDVAIGTHTGGSITTGEHRKRLAVQRGRDVTPSEIHLHVHTHGNDGKSFLGERSRIIHERYEEILQEQRQTQSDVDECQAYYQAAGGEKKRRVYGLGSQAHSYYGPNLRASLGSDPSSSMPPLNAEQTTMGNLDELVMRLVPAILPVLVERVREMISSPSHQPSTATESPSAAATDANENDVHALGSDDDPNPSA